MDEVRQGIVVVGIGNIIRSDDGFGVHAMRRLQDDPRTPQGITFVDGGTLGLELVSYVSDASRLLLLDAVDDGKPPGTIVRMNGDELRSVPGGASAHHLGVADLIIMLSLASDEPPDIVLLGVQPASTEWGTAVTPNVEPAFGPLVELAVAQLIEWTDRIDQSP